MLKPYQSRLNSEHQSFEHKGTMKPDSFTYVQPSTKPVRELNFVTLNWKALQKVYNIWVKPKYLMPKKNFSI